MDAILYILLGFAFGAGAVFIYFQQKTAALSAEARLEREMRTQMENQFKVTAQEAVKNAHESFLELAEAKLKETQKDSKHDLEKRQKAIEEMVKPVHENLKALSGAVDQSKGMYKSLHENMQSLGKETSKLAGALRNPAARGNWGEGMLERLLENSGLIKGVHYQMQVAMQGESGALRPDAVVNLPDSLHVVIDAKAPINDFVRNLDEDLDERAYKELQSGLALAVKGHINQLSKRAYWENLNSPDFVVLFLPSEHLFSAAIQADPTLLELAGDKKIVLASPILTMSLLRVVGMGWKQVDLAKNAQEISERGADLYKRLLTFTDKIEKIGRNIHTAMSGYNEAVGSLERSVLPAARKFKDLQGGATGPKELPDMKLLDESPRQVTLVAEDEDEKKRA